MTPGLLAGLSIAPGAVTSRARRNPSAIPRRTQRDQPAGSGREHLARRGRTVTQSPGPAITTTGSKFWIRVFLVAFHLERDGGQQVGHGQRHVGVAWFDRFPAQRTAWGRLPKDQG